MKKIITLSLILVAFIYVHAVQTKAQNPTVIQFAKGKSSAVVKGKTGSYGVTYLVKAKSGQKLVLTLTPTKKVGIKVETTGSYGEMVLLREEKGGTYEIGVEETGDITIFIGSTNHKSIPFTLTVKIAKLADI